MEYKLFNAGGIKKEFQKAGIKIGRLALLKFLEKQEKLLAIEIASAVRKTRISGRKVVREEDFS